jgi:hypothetical protein
MTEHHPSEEQVKNPEVEHETSDVSVRGVLGFGAAMVVVAVILHVLLWWMFDWFQAKDAAEKPGQSPWARTTEKRLPPEPRLEGIETAPVQRTEQEAEARLHRYGWVDREKGIVHMPIQEAMQLLLERQVKGRSSGKGSP